MKPPTAMNVDKQLLADAATSVRYRLMNASLLLLSLSAGVLSGGGDDNEPRSGGGGGI